MHRFAQAADAKHARTVGRLYAQQAMRRKGVERGAFCPKVAVLVTFWRGHDIDVDNAAACIKAYQDGIFDALGANDREVLAILSAKVHTEDKAKHRCKELWLFDEADKAQNLMQSVLVDAMRAADKRKGGAASAFGVDDRSWECAGITRVHDKKRAGELVLEFTEEIV